MTTAKPCARWLAAACCLFLFAACSTTYVSGNALLVTELTEEANDLTLTITMGTSS